MSEVMCRCGHVAGHHAQYEGPCLAIQKINESESGVCICKRLEEAPPNAPMVDKYASDHADMAYLSQQDPPKGRILSPAVRMSRALFVYEWAKMNKKTDGPWEVYHSYEEINKVIYAAELAEQ